MGRIERKAKNAKCKTKIQNSKLLNFKLWFCALRSQFLVSIILIECFLATSFFPIIPHSELRTPNSTFHTPTALALEDKVPSWAAKRVSSPAPGLSLLRQPAAKEGAAKYIEKELSAREGGKRYFGPEGVRITELTEKNRGDLLSHFEKEVRKRLLSKRASQVALLGSEVIGYQIGTIEERRTSHYHLAIASLFVEEAHHQEGIAQALLFETAKKAIFQGIPLLRMTVHAADTEMLALAQKIEFQEEDFFQDTGLWSLTADPQVIVRNLLRGYLEHLGEEKIREIAMGPGTGREFVARIPLEGPGGAWELFNAGLLDYDLASRKWLYRGRPEELYLVSPGELERFRAIDAKYAAILLAPMVITSDEAVQNRLKKSQQKGEFQEEDRFYREMYQNYLAQQGAVEAERLYEELSEEDRVRFSIYHNYMLRWAKRPKDRENIIGILKKDKVTQRLFKLLSSLDMTVKKEVVGLLPEVSLSLSLRKKAIAVLEGFIAKSSKGNNRLRQRAIFSLSELDPDRSVSYFEAIARDPNESQFVRRAAEQILSRHSEDNAQDGGSRRLYHLNNLVEQVVKRDQHLQRRPKDPQEDLEITYDLPQEDLYVENRDGTTETFLDSAVIDELIENAMKYTRVKYPEGGGKVHVSLKREGDEAVYRVTDNGIGIPEAEKERVWSEGYRASNIIEKLPTPRYGEGKGLAIAKMTIDRYRGTIRFDSKENEGTTFEVRLPLAEMAAKGYFGPKRIRFERLTEANQGDIFKEEDKTVADQILQEGASTVALKEWKRIGYQLNLFDWDETTQTPYLYISNMFVDDLFRRQGLGRALIFQMAEEAISRGVPLLRMDLHINTEGMFELAEETGFRKENFSRGIWRLSADPKVVLQKLTTGYLKHLRSEGIQEIATETEKGETQNVSLEEAFSLFAKGSLEFDLANEKWMKVESARDGALRQTQGEVLSERSESKDGGARKVLDELIILRQKTEEKVKKIKDEIENIETEIAEKEAQAASSDDPQLLRDILNYKNRQKKEKNDQIKALDRDIAKKSEEAVKRLAQLDPLTAPELLTLLKEKDQLVRFIAVRALAAIGPSAVNGLVAILQDKKEDQIVQAFSAWALGEIGDPSAIPPLLDAVKTGEVWYVRAAAAWALGTTVGKSKVKSDIALETLNVALKEEKDESVQRAITWALEVIEGKIKIDGGGVWTPDSSARDGGSRSNPVEDFTTVLNEFVNGEEGLKAWERTAPTWDRGTAEEQFDAWRLWIEGQQRRFIDWGRGSVVPDSDEARALEPLMERFLELMERTALLFRNHRVDTSETVGLAYIQAGNFYHFLLGQTDRTVEFYHRAPDALRETYFGNPLFGAIRKAYLAKYSIAQDGGRRATRDGADRTQGLHAQDAEAAVRFLALPQVQEALTPLRLFASEEFKFDPKVYGRLLRALKILHRELGTVFRRGIFGNHRGPAYLVIERQITLAIERATATKSRLRGASSNGSSSITLADAIGDVDSALGGVDATLNYYAGLAQDPRYRIDEPTAWDGGDHLSETNSFQWGWYTIVYDHGNHVEKEIRTKLAGVLSISDDERTQIRDRVVRENEMLREAGYPVPQSWSIPKTIGRLGQAKATGLAFRELKSRYGNRSPTVTRAKENYALMLRRARKQFPSLMLEPKLRNAIYNEQGEIVAWFDPTIPVMMQKNLEINARVIREQIRAGNLHYDKPTAPDGGRRTAPLLPSRHLEDALYSP